MPDTNLYDWQTVGSVVTDPGIPVEIIDREIMRGRLRVAYVCGERIVNRAEVQALALEMRAESTNCRGCDDE